MHSNKEINVQAVISGFAIFSVFFGAGNLIFPPYLVVLAGSGWTVFIGFVIGDAVIAAIAIVVAAQWPDRRFGLFARSGKAFYYIICIVSTCTSGPLVVIPRTCAVSYEVGILPYFPSCPRLLYSLIFFGIAFALTIKPSQVMDNLGKYLTPVLILVCVIIDIRAFSNPIGFNRSTALIDNLFKEGLIMGFQTFDALGGISISMVILEGLTPKGFTEKKEQSQVLIRGGVLAAVCLAVVYAGLYYMGEGVSQNYGADASTTELLVTCVNLAMGNSGQALLSIATILACLTTAIGSIASPAIWLNWFFKGRFKHTYEVTVIVVTLIGIYVSNLGVSAIIKITDPIVTALCPPQFSLVITGMFNKWIKSDWAFILTAWGGTLIGALDVMGSSIVQALPLYNVGACWLIPAIVLTIVGNFIPSKKNRLDDNLGKD